MIQTYKDLKEKTWNQPGIPKWVYRSGNESLENLHPDIIETYTRLLEDNDGYELFYFSEEDKLQVIIDQENIELLTAYNTIVPNAFKTDIFRYVILTTYGGVWMDFSMKTLVQLDDIIKNHTYVYVKDTASGDGVYNSFIITLKNNKFLKSAIDRCVYNITNRFYGETCLSITGPHMLGNLYKELYNVSEIPLGEVGKDTIFYNHRLPNEYIEEAIDKNIVRIKHPKHFEMLYTTQERYNIIWDKREMYGPLKIKGFKDLKDKKWKGDGIPKWIFKTGPFKLEELPKLMELIFLDILKNSPGYEMFYFSDEDCESSINHYYGEEYLKYYQKLIPTAYRADFWRYLMLNIYGGCYGDFSQVPLVSYNELTHGVDRVFVRDDPSNRKYLYNAIICVKPNDAVIKNAINTSIENIKTNNYGENPLDVTGPVVFGKSFLKKENDENNKLDEIFLGDYKGTRILQHKSTGGFVNTIDGKDVFVTKLGNHGGLVYNGEHKNIHYDQAWRDKMVFR
jgi:mannosyltransferase OCH1-like enzyme